MSSYRDDLNQVSEKERVALPEGFRITDQVLASAHGMLMRTVPRMATYYVCPVKDCNQSVFLDRDWRGQVEHSLEDRKTLMLDHLMKRHGWTRETVGEC